MLQKRMEDRLRCSKEISLICLCLIFSFLIPLLLSAPAHSHAWYVKPDGSGDAPTIQAAVDSASAGDSILVAAGKYFDTREVLVGGVLKKVNLHLYKNVKVIGESGVNKTMIKGYFSDIGIFVEGVDSTALICDFILETSWSGYTCVDTSGTIPTDVPVGIECRNSTVAITENLLHYNDIGVKLINSDAHIWDNEIHHSLVNIMCCEGSAANITYNQIHDGMRLIDCNASSPRIEGNDLRRACEGIRTRNGAYPLIVDNTIHFMWNWAVISYSGVVIEGNRFNDNSSGVRLEECVGSLPLRTVRDNLFCYSILAVEIISSGSAVIENNTIDACYFGVYCESGTLITLQKNIIKRPSFGVTCSAPCSLIIQCNNIYAAQIERYSGDCPDLTDIDGNISIDPEFCGLDDSGNYFLQSDSPCAPGNHPDGSDCGRIGAFDVNCGIVPVEIRTWGDVKSLYQTNRRDE